jgi:hypothetical protein
LLLEFARPAAAITVAVHVVPVAVRYCIVFAELRTTQTGELFRIASCRASFR